MSFKHMKKWSVLSPMEDVSVSAESIKQSCIPVSSIHAKRKHYFIKRPY